MSYPIRRRILHVLAWISVGLFACLPATSAQESDILFYASFDGSVDASVTKGTLAPQKISGTAQFEPGVHGKALVAGEAGALLQYATRGIVNPGRGSVEMWVKPVDWTPEEEGFHIFFMCSSDNGWVQLYKAVAAGGALLMLEGRGGGNAHVDYEYAATTATDTLATGQWVHLVGTWDSGNVALYANGALLSSVAHKTPPTGLGDTFYLGDWLWGQPRRACKTLIDEVRIYSRPLAPSEVKRIHRGRVGQEEQAALGPHRLTVVKTATPPTIDGVLTDTEWTEPEWRNVPALTGFIDLRTKSFATRQARAWFTWDDERLYFAVASDIEPGAPPLAQITQRDGALWGDDAVEFFIAPPAAPGAPDKAGREKPLYFQLLGNSAGVFLDGKSNDETWNGPWSYRAQVFGTYWAAEGSIGWHDLGIDPPKDGEVWRVNFARDWQNPQAWTVWGHSRNFHDVSTFAYVTCRDRGTIAQVENLGAFTSGNVAFDVKLANTDANRGDVVVGGLAVGSTQLAAKATVPPGGQATLEFRTRITDRSANALTLHIASETTGDVLWEGTFPFKWTDAIVAKLSPVPSADVIEAKVNLAGMAGIPRSPRARITFTEQKTERVVAEFSCAPFDKKNRSLTKLPMAGISVGRYDVVVTVLDGDATVGEAKIAFDRRDEPWQGNAIGRSDKILPGWTPIEVTGRKLACWGREVSFEGTLFPSEIVSRAAALLSSPIRLAATVDGRPVEWEDVSFEITGQTPARVDFVTSTRSEHLRIENTAYLEYDGMFLFSMKIVPAGDRVRVDSLALVIPFADQRAIFFHQPSEFPAYGGRVPQGNGVVWQRRFAPYMWVGDYDRGLTWFAEDCAEWNIVDPTGTLELARSGDTLEWQIRIADGPLTIDAPRTVVFGLQPTPVKPMPEGWRLCRPGIAWTNPDTTTHFGYPEAPDPAYIKRNTDTAHQHGERVLPYMHPVRVGEMTPEWQFYGRDWAMPGVIDASAADVVRFEGALMGTCPSVPAFRDWMVWKNERYLDATAYDGLYYDHAWPYGCSHAGHGHVPGATPLLGYRELYRRLYTLCKERDPDNLVAAHISGGLFSPMLSWTDVTIPGEELVNVMMEAREREETKNTLDIFDVIDLDYYHAWCTGRQFGQAPMYLAPKWSYPQHHNTYMLLTDSIGAWRTDQSLVQLYTDLGMDAADVEFLPFWDENSPVHATFAEPSETLTDEKRPAPLVSAYRRPGTFVMFAVCNMTRTMRMANVTFDASVLGFDLSACGLTDAYPRHPLCAARDSFEVEIEGHSYRLILLKKLGDGDTAQPDISAMTPCEKTTAWNTGTAKKITGTGRIQGDGKGLLLVGDAVRDEKAPLPQESRLAQTFTLAGPTKIQSIEIENREPKGGRRGLPCDLRIHRLNADGTPSSEQAHSKAWAWLASYAGSAGFYSFFFRESFVLPGGRYVFVLTKPAALPEERHHFAYGLHDQKLLPGETAMIWEDSAPGWKTVDGVLSFSVSGYER